MMTQDDLVRAARRYVDVFNQRDLSALATLFSEEVVLRDWSLLAEGRAQVLKATKGIFDAVPALSVEIVGLIADAAGRRVAAELAIAINETETVLVVDVIEFDDRSLITSIRAYKG